MAQSSGSGKAGHEPNLELPSLSLRRRRKAKPESASAPAHEEAAEQTQPTKPAAPRATPPSPPRPVPPPPPPAPAPPPPSVPAPDSRPRLSSRVASKLAASGPDNLAPRAPAAPAQVVPVVPGSADSGPQTRDPHADAKRASSAVAALERLSDRLDDLRFKEIPGHIAAILTGVICGLVCVLLGWLAASGCQAVRGVGTCGGFGLITLVAIIAIEVLIGGVLLRAWHVSDPTSTAFLGVGLVTVLAMLFFLGQIGSVWMILVIPVLSAAMFLLSWWVTAKIIETDG